MFEVVMLIGLLLAGLSQLLPEQDEDETQKRGSDLFRGDRGGADRQLWHPYCAPSRAVKVPAEVGRPKRNPCM